jgi:hypothetical protein
VVDVQQGLGPLAAGFTTTFSVTAVSFLLQFLGLHRSSEVVEVVVRSCSAERFERTRSSARRSCIVTFISQYSSQSSAEEQNHDIPDSETVLIGVDIVVAVVRMNVLGARW